MHLIRLSLTLSVDIRTYSVVPLNEECGLIEWVRNTTPFRELVKPRYDAIGVSLSVRALATERNMPNHLPLVEESTRVFR